MSLLSKPIHQFLGFYFEELFNHPVRTKCITSAVVASSSSYCAQKLSGAKEIQTSTVVAYGLFGFCFGGTIPHYFYSFMEKILPADMKLRGLMLFLSERFLLAPFFTALSLFSLALFEGKSTDEALLSLMTFYKTVLVANWSFLSLPVFLNFAYVPSLLRVLVGNLIGFLWILFLANKRRKAAKKEEKRE